MLTASTHCLKCNGRSVVKIIIVQLYAVYTLIPHYFAAAKIRVELV